VVAVAFVCIAGPLAFAGLRPEAIAKEQPVQHRRVRRVAPRPAPRPQYVVVSFDGSGGTQLWPYWRAVARRVHAHFTFFVSGVYLLDWAQAHRYRPPRHEPGRSDIGFAPTAQVVRGTLDQIATGSREGDEIGTHFNGHFCTPYPGNVGEWDAADWQHELDQFDRLMFGGHELPFGPAEVVGERTPCLEGKLPTLYGVLARNGFRYDASQVAPLGTWPTRELGIWSVPLLELPFVGHTFRVISMDYNFLANQLEEDDATVEAETLRSLRAAFRTLYRGNRAPMSIGYHFETWHGWAYDRALVQFLTETCGLPDVRCTSIRELVDWLDLRFPRLRLYPH
jgi:peptidoglycan/xylan/chitin deacetylase (PgdA/CDA1 family)